MLALPAVVAALPDSSATVRFGTFSFLPHFVFAKLYGWVDVT